MQQQTQKRPSRSGSRCRRCLSVVVSVLAVNTAIARCEDLDTLVQQALERNPAILAARRAVDARKSLIASARTLPDPTVSFETMGNPQLTLMPGDPSSARVLRFSQEIPFPGKLSLQGQIASAEADAENWKYEQVRREVVSELKMSYYDLLLAQKLTDVVEKSRTLLQQFAEISEARYKVGQGAQQDILKSQVEVSRLLDRLATLRRERDTAQARINTLLYRPPDTPIERAPEMRKPQFAWTLDELYNKALANNPDVRVSRKEIDRDELAVSLAKKSFYPDFEVEVSYFNRQDLPEMYGLMFKAKLPLYFWRRQRPELESATASLLAQRRQYDETLSTLYFRLKDPFLKISTDTNLLELYGKAIVPQATLALESSISSYRVGAVDFLSLLSNQSTVLEYEMKYYEVLADYCKTLVTLESLTGEVMTP